MKRTEVVIWAAALSLATTLASSAQPTPSPPTPSTCSEASIDLSPNPATAGNPVSLVGKAVESGVAGPGNSCAAGTAGTPITVGTIDIEKRVVGAIAVSCSTEHRCTAGLTGAACTGANAACDSSQGAGDGICTNATYMQHYTESPPDGNGEVDTTFDTTGLGGSTIGFRAHYKGGSNPFKQDQSPCVDLIVNQPAGCSGGVEIAASFGAGDGTPPPGPDKTTPVGPWNFVLTVTACENVSSVSAQGGDNGWAPTASDGSGLSPDTGSVSIRNNNRNSIVTWDIDSMTAGQEANLEVVVDGPIPPSAPDCLIRYLSGPWSALYSLDGGLTHTKTLYTGRVIVSVDTNNDGNSDCNLIFKDDFETGAPCVWAAQVGAASCP